MPACLGLTASVCLCRGSSKSCLLVFLCYLQQRFGGLGDNKAAPVCARECALVSALGRGRPWSPRWVPGEILGEQDLLQPEELFSNNSLCLWVPHWSSRSVSLREEAREMLSSILLSARDSLAVDVFYVLVFARVDCRQQQGFRPEVKPRMSFSSFS